MNSNRGVGSGRRALEGMALLALSGVCGSLPLRAENLERRWSFGGALSYLSTTDDIRSNAGIFVRSPGADGIFGTGDSGETRTCFDAPPAYCDPRPDDLIGRETSIEETVRFDISAAYGFTQWFSLQVEAGYFKGDVGPLDVYQQQLFPIRTGTGGVSISSTSQRNPIVAGKITEIPVSLTGVVRFRRDRAVNPYVGFGAGRIFTEIEGSTELSQLNAHLSTLRIRDKRDEFGASIAPAPVSVRDDGKIPLGSHRVTIDAEDLFEWHAVGGLEYFFNDRTSIVFDARYVFADTDRALSISLGGEDQVNFSILAPELFREDGSVRFYNNQGRAPNTLCTDAPDPPRFDPRTAPRENWVGCPTPFDAFSRVYCVVGRQGNYDGGPVYPNDPDLCYDPALFNGQLPNPAPWGDVVVQGGEISLTGFSATIGLRFHF